MTATTSTSPSPVDASCRLPLFTLFGGAAIWLLASSVLSLIASIKFHGPNFLSACPSLTYGRVYPASTSALVYGFAIPAGLGVLLWLIARLGRVTLARPWLIAFAAKLWHFGVFVGLIGILGGDATGFEWLEMPRYAAAFLFVSFLLMALCGFLTYQARTERALYPSLWFVLAALFWFPWIYSTANLLLLVFPVRGVTQAAVNWWFSGNLFIVWFSLVGLAASFYFLPKLTERPLQSHHLALFVFWTLNLFGTWVGIPASATLPAWMPALSNGAAVLAILPALGVGVSVWLTARGSTAKCSPGASLCFVKFGVGSFVLAGLLLALSSVPEINRFTEFTWFTTALTHFRIYGFFAMTMFGAIYYILPRITGLELPFGKMVRVHFWLSVIGMLLLPVALAAGGVVQGLKLSNLTVAFDDTTKATLMFLRISTVGDLILLLGSVLFALNVIVLMVRYYRAVYTSAYKLAIARLETAEVRT